jgi:osmotically-inducible protein OsmY
VLAGKLRAAASPLEDRRSTDDVTIADRIKSEVLGRKDLRAGSLLVDVTDGVAHLRGRMDDVSRLERVIDLTGKVRGVREVDNFIEVA